MYRLSQQPDQVGELSQAEFAMTVVCAGSPPADRIRPRVHDDPAADAG
jgi:hypothetical protein